MTRNRLLPLGLTLCTLIFAQTLLASVPEAARHEGALHSLAMPDDWANWRDTWRSLEKQGIQTRDTDMSSAQALAKFQAEGQSGESDIADVGFAYAPLAVEKGLTQAYKPSTWQQIPHWAKDHEGQWMLSYTGTIAFLVDTQKVPLAPRTWRQLLDGRFRVTVGDVGAASQANNVVLAAAFALGGNEGNLNPAFKLFKQLAAKNRLDTRNPSEALVAEGEMPLAILWDFNALQFRNRINPQRFQVLIPEDGSVQSGYSTLIHRHAPHPNAARWAREFILSDQGQLNLALGYARPIRYEYLNLSDSVKRRLLPIESYRQVHHITQLKVWSRTSQALPRLWQTQVFGD